MGFLARASILARPKDRAWGGLELSWATLLGRFVLTLITFIRTESRRLSRTWDGLCASRGLQHFPNCQETLFHFHERLGFKMLFVGGLLDLIETTISHCSVVSSKSGVTINISNNGSSLTLLCTLTQLHSFCPGRFRIVTVALSCHFNNVSNSCSRVRGLYSDLSMGCVMGGASL